MKSSIATALVVAVVVVSAVASGCEDLRIPIGKTPDQLLPLRPVACADVPVDTATPVKLMIAVDVSGSMEFTDQEALRWEAVARYVAGLDEEAQRNTQIATFGFGVNVLVDPPVTPGAPLFVPAGQWLMPEFAGLADVQTDHSAVLDAMGDHLLIDALQSSPAELALTRYVIVILTDGASSPICCNAADQRDGEIVDAFGCAAEEFEEPAIAGSLYCGSSIEQSLCNDSAFLDRFRELNPATPPEAAPDYGSGQRAALSGLVVGGDYNRPGDLTAKADRLFGLAQEFGIGGLDLHVAFLFDDSLDADIRAIYGLNRCRIEATANAIAGSEGDVTAFGSPAEIDFSIFRADPLCPVVGDVDDCQDFCLRSRGQLIDEFGFDADVCDDAAIVAAGVDCAACEAAFADSLGLLADVCPPS